MGVFSENNINKIFQNGHLLYQGYVDDPRNTDNSWMETQGRTITFVIFLNDQMIHADIFCNYINVTLSRYDCDNLAHGVNSSLLLRHSSSLSTKVGHRSIFDERNSG